MAIKKIELDATHVCISQHEDGHVLITVYLKDKEKHYNVDPVLQIGNGNRSVTASINIVDITPTGW